VNTYCKDCIFDQEDGCALDKIELYEKHDIEINTDFDSPILYNFICPFHRDITWLSDKNPELSAVQLENRIVKENGFPYSFFMYAHDSIDVESVVDEILSVRHKPKYLSIAFAIGQADQVLILRLADKISKHKIKYRFSINTEKEFDHFYESYLIFRLNNKQPFVAICFNNFTISNKEFTTEISEKIQRELLSFPYANTENKELIIFPNSILEEYIAIEGSLFIDRILETQCQTYVF
jgi:hypothetical protein